MPELEKLSPRQRRVVDLIAHGHANKEIAARLHLAEGTVKIYACLAFKRLNVSTRCEFMSLLLDAANRRIAELEGSRQGAD